MERSSSVHVQTDSTHQSTRVKLHLSHSRFCITMPAMVWAVAALSLTGVATARAEELGDDTTWGTTANQGLIEQDHVPSEMGSSIQGSPLMIEGGYSVLPPINNDRFTMPLDSFRARASMLDESVKSSIEGIQPGDTIHFHNWWEAAVQVPFGIAAETISIDVGGLTQTALSQSPLVRSILTEPKILQNDLVVEHAAFDSLAFIEGKFADTNDPVGSALVTGNASDRFLDDTFSSAAGLRKRSQGGGTLDVAQRSGFQSNNSTFLIPNPQNTTRLEVNFTQPLMRDRGKAVNQTRIVLAQIDVQLANAEAHQDLQDHLIDVAQAYWTLYQSRAEWLQRKRLYETAQQLHDVLKARSPVDSTTRQILRTEAAVASRRADLVRIETRIRNAQAQLRTLTGDPQLRSFFSSELIPMELPLAAPIAISQRDATLTALDNRPDIAESIRKIQATSTRVGAAKNQVLPRLDLILHSHVAGLDAGRDPFNAFANQFSDGGPSYAAGLLYEAPFGNRAAQARYNRNRWELTRAMLDFQQTTEQTFTEVEIAVRECQTSFAEMVTKKQSIDAATREVSYLEQRWALMPHPNDSAVLLIENLLDAQERLADEERGFVAAQVGYAMSWVQLRKAMGVLLRLSAPNMPPELTP